MTIVKRLRNGAPKIAENVFLAENCTIIGQVELEEGVSVWYSAVIRGDVGKIKVGRNTNIQDLAMVHCTYNHSETCIGEGVTVGHSAIIHGCEIKDNCLIGMGAIIMDKVVVNENVIVGAGSVVLENSILESGFLYAGTPAKKIKPISPEQIEGIKKSAEKYALYGSWYKEDLELDS